MDLTAELIDVAIAGANRFDRGNLVKRDQIDERLLLRRSMDTQQHPRRLPKVQFRVLIIGRANAGKTSILQRVCDTTESPVIYRGKEKVRAPTFLSASLISLPT